MQQRIRNSSIFTLSSLKYFQPGDIDALFPSPKKSLLAEKRILEQEIRNVVEGSNRAPLKPLDLSNRLNTVSLLPSVPLGASCQRFPVATAARVVTANSLVNAKPLDRKKCETEHNLTILEVQITSASSELEKLKAEEGRLTPIAAIFGRISGQCHKSGHTKTASQSQPCPGSSTCKIRDKYPELKKQIAVLQRELKALQKHQEKQGSELDNFAAAREKSTSSFFSVMRPPLRLQNLPKYIEQQNMRNKVPDWRPEEGEWQLPLIIEQYYHAKVAPYMPLHLSSEQFYIAAYVMRQKIRSFCFDYTDWVKCILQDIGSFFFRQTVKDDQLRDWYLHV